MTIVLASDLPYPILGFREAHFSFWESQDALGVQYLRAIRSGYVEEHTLVDSTGTVYRIVEVTAVGGVRLMTSLLDLVIGQRVQVDILVEPTGERWDVERARSAVLRELEEWHGWQSRGDYDEVVDRVRSSTDLQGLLTILGAALR